MPRPTHRSGRHQPFLSKSRCASAVPSRSRDVRRRCRIAARHAAPLRKPPACNGKPPSAPSGRQWEEEGTGVGGGFEIDQDALLQFTDPHTVSLALQPPADDSPDGEGDTPARIATRGQRLLRTLVEDTALLYADLHPLDAEYARGQRSWLADRAADMTGGTVEMRAEGMLLRLPQDRSASSTATVQFPAATAAPWFALKMLDAATSGRQPDESGRIALGGAEVETAATRVYQDNYGALTKVMKESPARMLSIAQEVLLGAGIIRQADAGWVVLPVAARYRDPKALWEPTLDDFGDDAGAGAGEP
jgi:hypothetical protein